MPDENSMVARSGTPPEFMRLLPSLSVAMNPSPACGSNSFSGRGVTANQAR